MMTAKEARELADKSDRSDKEVENLLREINAVATKGYYQLNLFAPLDTKVARKIQDLGYTIVSVIDRDYNGAPIVKITW